MRQRLDAWLTPVLACADTEAPVSAEDAAWVAEGFALLREYGPALPPEAPGGRRDGR